MYLRFVLPSVNPCSNVRDGIFEAAYALQEEGGLHDYEAAALDALLRWFEENLPIPSRFNRTRSKGFWRRDSKGISWFKASAHIHVGKVRALTEILENHGHRVQMIKSARPGYVVYEDAHQIVAEPFNKRPVVTADQRFFAIANAHPYLAAQVVALEGLA